MSNLKIGFIEIHCAKDFSIFYLEKFNVKIIKNNYY
jgi:hypothetical protein